jgi:TPR repeat protein
MYNLARSLDKAEEYHDAVTWYERAAHLNLATADNNLGVLYIYGRGVPRMDFARGTLLIGKSAGQGYAQAKLNFSETDYTILFEDNPQLTTIIQMALVSVGFLQSSQATGKWEQETLDALASFKRSLVVGPGVTLSLLDQLGVVQELDDEINRQRR